MRMRSDGLRATFALTEAQLANTDVAGSLDVWLEGEPQRIEADFDNRLVSIDDFVEESPEEEAREFDMDRFLATLIPVWTVPDIALRLQFDADAIHWDDTVFSEATSTPNAPPRRGERWTNQFPATGNRDCADHRQRWRS